MPASHSVNYIDSVSLQIEISFTKKIFFSTCATVCPKTDAFPIDTSILAEKCQKYMTYIAPYVFWVEINLSKWYLLFHLAFLIAFNNLY